MSDLIEHDRNKDGAIEFIDAVVRNEPIWPNPWGQDVAFVAFVIHSDRQRIAELEAELAEWEKLKDPINLHVNLLRGVPCRLDRMQHLLHLAGATDYDYLKAANAKMSDELETERIRLAACGVVALANTPESAAKAREMKDEYRSASCDDVARLVDSEMKMRKCLEAIESIMNEAGKC